MIQLEVHSKSTAELRRGSQAQVGMLPAVVKGPPLSKIIIGTGLDMTDLVPAGQAPAQHAGGVITAMGERVVGCLTSRPSDGLVIAAAAAAAAAADSGPAARSTSPGSL